MNTWDEVARNVRDNLTTAELNTQVTLIETDYADWAVYKDLVAEQTYRRNFNTRMKNHRQRANELSAAIANLIRTMNQASLTQRGQY